MTNVHIDDLLLPELTELDSVPISTPMQRAASQLARVLPPGWKVEVAEATYPTARKGQPALRLVMPED
ncbi:hypothetical protein [Nocardia sp. NPDC020380]|uniref:hypothetical protein n=1 Tax=Nocardia sp. NPDC020380 TaxID=3364309 RepID=UPI00379F16CD